MGGPVVIAHGTEAQKQRYLKPILTGEEIWCQGFSEPESGSDLASLKTRAVKDGDERVVTGQKVWTTLAQFSKWCMLVARTDPDAPKHKGLTYFLMDMKQDGVEAQPLVQITGEGEFNEVFINEARIPDENVVGGVGNGWTVAITTLMNERAGLAFGLPGSTALAELATRRRRSARTAARAKRGFLSASGSRSSHRGRDDAPERLPRADQDDGVGLPAPRARSASGSGPTSTRRDRAGAGDRLVAGAAPRANGAWQYGFLRSRANSIEGGTTDILKNIVAERVLGLPRMR